jgi:hypothetical protein
VEKYPARAQSFQVSITPITIQEYSSKKLGHFRIIITIKTRALLITSCA